MTVLDADVLVETELENIGSFGDTSEDRPDMLRVRNAMIDMHLPIVRAIADRISAASQLKIAYEDLISAGLIGLVNALSEYTPGCRMSFGDYCKKSIADAMQDAIRLGMWVVNR